MKINKPTTVATPAAQPTQQKPTTAPPAADTKGWQARGAPGDAAVRHSVTKAATAAVVNAIANPGTSHPLLEKFGQELGLGLGVLVTEGLAAVPSWNAPVLDANGKPVQSVEGATRIGDHDILKRHEEVVGPKIAAMVEKMAPGALRDLMDGLAKGASAAPGTSYRLEAQASDFFRGK